MAPNSPVCIEVDKEQAKLVNKWIITRFNRENTQRPGNYQFRYQPEKDFLTVGNGSAQHRINTLKKHRAVVLSLHLFKTNEIMYLDREHEKTTLRSWLQEQTWPIIPAPGKKSYPLIHSVDWAPTGEYKDQIVYVTAYADRADKVEQMVSVLPALIRELISEEACKLWFAPQVEETQITIETDDAGNWTGNWTTPDDKMMQDIANEDMGISIHFEGVENLEPKRRVITQDDVSHHFTQGGGSTLASASMADDSSAAATSTASGGSGTTT